MKRIFQISFYFVGLVLILSGCGSSGKNNSDSVIHKSNDVNHTGNDENDDVNLDGNNTSNGGNNDGNQGGNQEENQSAGSELLIANAGKNRSINLPSNSITNKSARVVLNGYDSIGVDDSVYLTYRWEFVSKPEGSQSVLQYENTEHPRFDADKKGMYEVELTISDGRTQSSDSVLISVTKFRASSIITTEKEQRITYNDNGDLIISTHDYERDGNIDSRVVYVYNEDDTLASSNYDINFDNIYETRTVYTYDVDKKLIRYIQRDEDDVIQSVAKYSYDVQQNILKIEESKGLNIEPDRVFSYTYDSNNNKLSTTIENSGQVAIVYVYIYDRFGNLRTEYRNLNENGTYTRKTIYAYSQQGNIISSLSYESDNDPVKISKNFFYDAKGQLFTKTTISHNTDYERKFVAYKYDEHSNIVETDTSIVSTVIANTISPSSITLKEWIEY